VNSRLYLEGGGDSKEGRIRCREGFRKLLEQSGFLGKLPRLTACGGRANVFDDFKTSLASRNNGFVAMLIDSEDPLEDLERAWDHLKRRDGWVNPPGATDEQVFFMTTCMETWIVADRIALRDYFRATLHESALPSLVDLEKRERGDILKQLTHATRDCSNAYSKGRCSFEVLGKLNPSALNVLPSFARMVRILKEKL